MSIEVASLRKHYKVNDFSAQLDILSTDNDHLSPQTVNIFGLKLNENKTFNNCVLLRKLSID